VAPQKHPQRYTKTGIFECVSTLTVSLPRTTAERRGYWRERAVFAPDPRLRTAARWPGAAAELALCSRTRPAIIAPQLRDGLFDRFGGGQIMLAALGSRSAARMPT
jgi:hypothetical protein